MYPQPFVPWVFREQIAFDEGDPDRIDSIDADRAAAVDLVGYDVEATDGSIGSVDEANHEVGGAYLVVDTGPWIFGRKVVLPAGTVARVDHEDRRVYVDRTKDQINDSPEYDEDTPAYRQQVGDYYTENYREFPG